MPGWTVPLKLLLPVAAFGGIAMIVLPADLHAVHETPLISTTPAAMKPAFNAAPIPKEALNRAPTVSEPPSAPVAAPVQSWRPEHAPEIALTAAVQSAEPDNLPRDRVNSAVNVRAAGRKGTPVLFVLPAGAEVRVAETEAGWVHVYSDAGEGWVFNTFIGAARPAAPAADTEPSGDGRTVRVASAVTVWDEPGGDPLYELDRGERIRILETDGNWARVVTASGEGGWVRLR